MSIVQLAQIIHDEEEMNRYNRLPVCTGKTTSSCALVLIAVVE